jgi:hypothetical protein
MTKNIKEVMMVNRTRNGLKNAHKHHSNSAHEQQPQATCKLCMMCIPMSVLTITTINTQTNHNIKIPLMIHHVQ